MVINKLLPPQGGLGFRMGVWGGSPQIQIVFLNSNKTVLFPKDGFLPKRSVQTKVRSSTLPRTTFKVFSGGDESNLSVPLWSKLNFCSCTRIRIKLNNIDFEWYIVYL